MSDIKVLIKGKEYTYKKNTLLVDISKDFKDDFISPILCAFVDNVLVDLNYPISEECSITFLDCTDRVGNKIYQKGLIFLLVCTFNDLYGQNNKIKVCHSIDKGINIRSSFKITLEDLSNIKKNMEELINLDLPFSKCIVKRKDAITYFNMIDNKSKADSYLYSTDEYVILYKLKDMYDYFYSIMPLTTGVLKYFNLTYVSENNFILQFPIVDEKINIPDYVHHEKLIDAYDKNYKYGKKLNIQSAADVNKLVSQGSIRDIIKLDEVMSNNYLLEIASSIANDKNIKVIMLAGPSSSGKTTTARKLSLFLRTFGINPKPLSLDDYFLEREETPILETGEYDYESVNAIDLDLFHKQLESLLNMEEVSIPTYNFYTGKKEYNNKLLKLEENDILIIEGLHGLNEILTNNIPKSKKCKIYISELTDLNIDDYNIVSTSDVRLLRRIVRDNRTRGYSVEETLSSWRRVRDGEEKYVFPFQDEADFIFNTAFLYEIGVLKIYAEPLLYQVKTDSKYYEEAKRLLNFLNMFLSIPTDEIPSESLLKEFIGDSYFE